MPPADKRGRGGLPSTDSGTQGHAVLHPQGWPPPKGYAYGVVGEGRVVCLSGIVGWDQQGRFAGDDLVSQARQALQTIVSLLREAGATSSDIVRMTWYVIDKHEYVAAQAPLGAAYREVIGRHFPAMSVVQVAGLLEDRARVEIEVTAIVGAKK